MAPPAPLARRLIVEGPDDRETLLQLCNAHGYNLKNQPAFEILVAGGIDRVPSAFRSAVLGSYSVVGAMVDADGPGQGMTLTQRWRSWQAQLGALAYRPPETLPAGGLVLKPGDRPTVGLWIMPDNQRDGALEDWLMDLVPAGDPLMPAARAAVSQVGSAVAEPHRYADKDRSKAELHTFLACKPITPTPSGLAFTRNYLDPNHSMAQALLSWLRALFG